MEKKKYITISEVEVEDIVRAGITIVEEAKELHKIIKAAVGEEEAKETSDPRSLWQNLVAKRALKPWHPHKLHQLLYYSVYAHWDASINGPPLYWFPSLHESKATNLGRVMEIYGPKLLGASYKDPISSFGLFQKFTVEHPEIYWSIVLEELSVVFREQPRCILDTTDESKLGGSWLPGAALNVAECCLLPSCHPRKCDDNLAVVWREEGDDSRVNCMTLKQLREKVMLVANALDASFSRGDAIAIDMPMTVNAVIIYLAIVLAGCVVVSIADSFPAKEIATRLRVSNAKGIFTQDFIIRGGKKFPLYSRVVEASSVKAIVLPAAGNELGIILREQDQPWKDFLCSVNHLPSGATLALYHGSPLGRGFGKFVQDAGVTLLGTVPSMVKAWKSTDCMADLDWGKIKYFYSAGEASDVDDDLWLSSRASYKPVIELCGATETSGSFIQGNMLQPQAFGACSSSLATGVVILHENGLPYPDDDRPCVGEMGLFPLYMGASERLLNADHYETSSLEIERVCNHADESILESVAVSVAPQDGGPQLLVIFVVLKQGFSSKPEELKKKFSMAIQRNLNPLFKVNFVKIVPEIPRTSTNKLLRRVLRDQMKIELTIHSKI
ncbi:hypothetical protein Tsubulata_039483 [Turnera subulata]|uniref:AMP-dependent synthetase/ligase domain-containing protein n=1 Tax=Turnera subulata TaxID=218843 RepID=A0A9Q0JH87_9ROSI|nr:hypothetical protein Tsubulata_039483 [Turnera subulata]